MIRVSTDAASLQRGAHPGGAPVARPLQTMQPAPAGMRKSGRRHHHDVSRSALALMILLASAEAARADAFSASGGDGGNGNFYNTGAPAGAAGVNGAGGKGGDGSHSNTLVDHGQPVVVGGDGGAVGANNLTASATGGNGASGGDGYNGQPIVGNTNAVALTAGASGGGGGGAGVFLQGTGDISTTGMTFTGGDGGDGGNAANPKFKDNLGGGTATSAGGGGGGFGLIYTGTGSVTADSTFNGGFGGDGGQGASPDGLPPAAQSIKRPPI